MGAGKKRLLILFFRFKKRSFLKVKIQCWIEIQEFSFSPTILYKNEILFYIKLFQTILYKYLYLSLREMKTRLCPFFHFQDGVLSFYKLFLNEYLAKEC